MCDASAMNRGGRDKSGPYFTGNELLNSLRRSISSPCAPGTRFRAFVGTITHGVRFVGPHSRSLSAHILILIRIRLRLTASVSLSGTAVTRDFDISVEEYVRIVYHRM